MVKKKTTKKKSKLTENEKEELKAEGELPKKNVRESENRQLMWFLIIVGSIFAAVLIPYFWIENSKTFEWGGADWVIEGDSDLRLYHGRFMILDESNRRYNIWMRNDPRKDNVYTEGEFDAFKYGGYISETEDIKNCRGEIPRARLDLKSFIKTGLMVGIVDNAAVDMKLAEELNYSYVDCSTNLDRTVIILKMGEPSVIQSEINPYCYTITIRDCEDNEPIEKFITKAIHDFNLKYK